MGILTSIVALICDLKKNIYKNNTQTNEAIDPGTAIVIMIIDHEDNHPRPIMSTIC